MSRISICTAVVLVALSVTAMAQERMDRTVPPIPEPQRQPITEMDARKATPPPRFEVKAPKGAPNETVPWEASISGPFDRWPDNAFTGTINKVTVAVK